MEWNTILPYLIHKFSYISIPYAIRYLNLQFHTEKNFPIPFQLGLGRRGCCPPLARRKKEGGNGKNALSAHLHGLFAAIEVSNDF